MFVQIETSKPPFSLLTPIESSPRSVGDVVDYVSSNLINQLKLSGIVAIDFETKGTDPLLGDNRIVGVGLAYDAGNIYIDTSKWTRSQLTRFLNTISGCNLVAHNVMFDGLWYYHYTGKHPRWKACTFGMYKHLATEGWPGQKWSLKAAMVDLLGWPESNERDLDDWLVTNGYHKTNKAPDKSQMWRAPSDILGKYCILDSEATYLLYTQVFWPALEVFTEYSEYHVKPFLGLVETLIEQVLAGIILDQPKLAIYHDTLADIIRELECKFREHEQVAPVIAKYKEGKLFQYLEKEPVKHKKGLKEPTPPAKTHKKNGEITSAYNKYLNDKHNYDNKTGKWTPKISKNWLTWKANYDRIEADLWPKYRFNIASKPQLSWLFYEELGYEIKVRNPPTEMNKQGAPSVSEKALMGFGEEGKILNSYNLAQKEMGYVKAYLDMYNTRTKCLHPGWIAPGTLTGRLAGRKPNLQQVPKKLEVMECFVPETGKVWLDCDHKALEQVVLAELSRDESLLKLYGPGAKPNDVYLFVGSYLPVIGDSIRAAGYDPDSPTTDAIARTKKKCKRERSIAKVVVLASSYGAGAAKIQATLSLQGIHLSLEEAQKIHKAYWDLFGGVKRFEAQLIHEWEQNGGWVLNGIGRPIGIYEGLKKDIVNRVVQSTGHDLHMMWVAEWKQLLKSRNIAWTAICVDWHDQSIIEVDKQDIDKVFEIVGKIAYDKVNERLGGHILLEGDPQIVNNLAEAKLEL